MTRIVEILLIPLLTYGSMRAPSISKIYSPNGKYYCEKIPGRYFKDSTEQYCKGSLFRVNESGQDELIWSRFFTNKSSPYGIMVSNDGNYVVTIGNWGSKAGGDNVVVIYGSTGEIIKKYSFKNIAPGNDLVERVKKGGHNIGWGGRHDIDEEHKILVLKIKKNCEALISGVQIHYDVGIDLATGEFVNVDSVIGFRLTEEDKADIYRLALELAIIKKQIPYYEWLKYEVTQSQDTLRIMSGENIEPWLIPSGTMRLLVLDPARIQKLADTEGDFLYIYFDHPLDLKDSIVTVRISSAWAKNKDSDITYNTEGGLLIEFHKESDKWVIKKATPVAQSHGSD